MKILLYSDVHIATKESLITKYGTKYTMKLEYLISGLNWAFRTAEKLGCSATICLGDFMHKAQCNDMELTALLDIKWPNMPNYFLCGNHESSVADLRYSTVNALAQNNNIIINTPLKIEMADSYFYFIPYITESDRKPLSEYLLDYNVNKHNYIISHNDIANLPLGSFKTTTGFDIKEIESLPNSLFLNGHIHNGGWVGKNALNVGSISGHNFTNDSYRYKYGIWILDTENNEVNFIENPYAFNFYKIEINTNDDLNKLKALKNQAVISIKCDDTLVEKTRQCLSDLKDTIVESRIILVKKFDENTQSTDLNLTVDHLTRFVDCCRANLDNNSLLEEELSYICS